MTGPADWLRLAGRGRLEDGGTVRWSVAEGKRGWRWRWTVVDAGIVRHAGLVEIDVEGRLGRLELASSDGLLTLHPSDDRTELHGNVIGPDGVRPLAFPADERTDLAIESDGACLWIRAGLIVGPGRSRPPRLALDFRGVPQLDDASEWPLED